MDSEEISGITRRQFVASSAAVLATGGFAHAADRAVAGRLPANGHSDKKSDPGSGRGPFRVIIDTDPGVDDALALLLAMRSPELKIEAITPVAGNVPLDLTLPNALRMVEIAGRTKNGRANTTRRRNRASRGSHNSRAARAALRKYPHPRTAHDRPGTRFDRPSRPGPRHSHSAMQSLLRLLQRV